MLWVAIFHGWRNGVGHVLYEVPENGISGEPRGIAVDLNNAPAGLTLKWKVSQEKPACDKASYTGKLAFLL